MNDLSFDSLSRFAAGAIPDRGQGHKRGTAGLAPLARSVTAEAKKNKSKKHKSRKKANERANELANQQAQQLAQQQQCQNQVGQCTTDLATFCKDDAKCLALLQKCCPLLASCNTAGFLNCLAA
jgi:hypothetical protein